MSEWKEGASKRRDFRRTKDAPEVPQRSGQKDKKRKKWVVEFRYTEEAAEKVKDWQLRWLWGKSKDPREWRPWFSKYATEKDANNAVDQLRKNGWRHSTEYEFRVVGPDTSNA